MPARPLLGGAILVLSLGLPSAAKVARYVGAVGALVYLLTLAVVVIGASRLGVVTWAASIPPRSANALMVATLVVLVMAFVVIYPRVTFGSDRDEALDLATSELLHGRFPYSQRVFPTGVVHVPGGGNPISPMPGELLLAVPFVLLGGGAWQTFFWLAALFYLAAAVLGSRGRALLAVWSMLLLAPAALHEVLTGGDLLANSLWVLDLGALAVATSGGPPAAASALLFGVGLSSRAHFALLMPILFVVLGQRWGWRPAAGRCALAMGAFAAVTLPFYAHDPAGFSPLHVVATLEALDSGLPYGIVIASATGSLLAAAALALRHEAASDGNVCFACAVVLSISVAAAVALACLRDGAVGVTEYGWYAVSAMPFGVLASLVRR